ncbi:MAG: hypothetical protein IAG10_24355 [Planctomycetaceae bacterium]|nr:hypothetical protein [Planctomycetaceae bacterium]
MSRNLMFDNRPESYGSFFTDDFAKRIFEASDDVETLKPIVFDLVADWRAASYAGAMPGLIPSSLKGFHDAFVNDSEPNTGTLQMATAVAARVSQLMPELTSDPALQRRFRECLVQVAAEMKEINGKIRVEMSLDEVWEKYTALPPFIMGLSGTLRLVLVSVYSAYENFVVRALSLAHNGRPFSVKDKKEFAKGFRGAFGDFYDRAWTHSRIHAYRLVRHSFVHAGGRVTKELRDVRIPVVVQDDFLHVYPEHIKELYGLLSGPALELAQSKSFRASGTSNAPESQ